MKFIVSVLRTTQLFDRFEPVAHCVVNKYPVRCISVSVTGFYLCSQFNIVDHNYKGSYTSRPYFAACVSSKRGLTT